MTHWVGAVALSVAVSALATSLRKDWAVTMFLLAMACAVILVFVTALRIGG
jgi:hypothetical protein